MLNAFLGLLAVIVVAIAVSMFLDKRLLSYLINNSDVPVLNTDVVINDVINEVINEVTNTKFLMNTQISDDIPYNY